MKEKNFEASMQRLEEIVSLLEDGSIPLEESIKLFEEGTKLAQECNTKLAQAEQKITQLTSEETKEEA